MLLGSPDYWHSGGGIWLVFFQRRDGRFVVIGAEGEEVHESREAYEAGQEGLQRFEWE